MIAALSTRLIGLVKANTLRQLCAFSILAACAYTIGQGHHGTGFICFVFSGAVGIGIADMAAYFAIKKIGARLAILLVQCGTAPFGALVEWL